MPVFSQSNSSEKTIANSNRKSRRPFGRRALLWGGLAIAFLVVTVLLATGPAFPLVGKWVIREVASSQGIEGDLKVSGSLWGDFTLSDVQFSGNESELVSLEIGKAQVQYSASGLIFGFGKFNWLKTVRIEEASIVLSLPEAVEPEETGAKPPPRSEKQPSDFSPVWNLLDATVAIEELKLDVRQGENVFSLAPIALTYSRGDKGQFSVGQISLPQSQDPIAIGSKLTSSDHSIAFQDFTIGEFSTIQSLAFTESSPGLFEVKTEIAIAGGVVLGRVTTAGEASVQLRPGTRINLSALPLPQTETGESLPLTGEVTDLDFRFRGDFATPSSWKVGSTIVGNGLGWDKYQLRTVALVLADEKLSLEVLRDDARLLGSFVIPFSDCEEIEELANLAIRGEAFLEIPSIDALLTDLVGESDWNGSLRADLKDLQIREGTRFDSGNLLVTSENLRWNDRPVSTFQAAATVEADSSISVAANVALDPETSLRIDGSLDPVEQSYEGRADLKLAIDGLLREILTEVSVPLQQGAGTIGWSGRGNLKTASHTGLANLSFDNIRYDSGIPLALDSEISYQDKNVQLSNLDLVSDPLSLAVSGGWDGERFEIVKGALSQNGQARGNLTASVPLQIPSDTPFLENDSPISANLTLDQFALGEVFRLFSEKPPVRGDLNGNLDISGSFSDLVSRGTFRFLPILETEETEVGLSPVGESPATQVDLELDFRGDVAAPNSWDLTFSMNLSGLQWDGREIDDVAFHAETREENSQNQLFAKLAASVARATLDSRATLDLSDVAELSDLKALPVALDLDFACPDLSEPWRDFAPPKWQSIPLAGDLSVKVTKGVWGESSLRSGELLLHSDALRLFDETFEEIRIDATVTQPDYVELEAIIKADEWSHVAGTGGFDLKTQAYRGSLESALDLESDGVLRGLLADRTIAALLPAKTRLDASIEGEIPGKTLSGSYSLAAEDLLLAPKASPIRTLSSSGQFTEKSLGSDLSLTSAPFNLEGRVDWEDTVLRLTDWVGTSKGQKVIALDGLVPLDTKKLAESGWFASASPIDLVASIDALPFSTIYELIGQSPPVRGQLDLNLKAKGSPAKPEVSMDLSLDALAVSGDESIPAGSLSVQLTTSEETAQLDGAYRHPDVQPLRIKAQVPFHPGAWATGERDFAEESISLTAKMDRSSLSFLATQIPAIQSIAGIVALDIAVDGKLGAPEINGDGLIEISRLRLQQVGAPSFYDIEMATSFSKNQVSIDRLSAVVAGGIVNVRGGVRFEPESEPDLDFQLTGREILLFRNPEVSLRTDADLVLRGPWSIAAITGEVGIVNSRYFKNFDLLPTSIPLPTSSNLPEIAQGPRGGGAAYSDLDFGVKIEPFQNWNSDIRVYTKTPFLIRSNLVESDLVADIRIGGTLGRPAPNGTLEIAEGEFSLPFSSVDVETGTIRFDENTGFNGAIELKARAKADQYRINAYLYNRVLDPKYVLTSVPPMPSEDIITLLVTGTTRDDLISGDAGSLAASKAATLLFKNFRKASAKADREPNILDELEERTELEIGGINAESGAETIGGKIRLWKQLFFVGNVDSSNDYRAVLKYVFRFR